MDYIEVIGAREHNLKNINVRIPHNKLTVITGLSGSGKSSLAFDTIYAEGQRRYLNTFSAYARQFIGMLRRPDVDKISGLAPVIAIEQKTINKNPRSTVGTITEIYDYLRLWFARAADAYSYVTGEKMVKFNLEQTIELIRKTFAGKKIYILAPVIKSRKGHYRELFERFAKLGFTQARIDGSFQPITPGMKLERFKTHDIEIVIDKIVVPKDNSDSGGFKRLSKSIELAMKYGKDTTVILDKDSGQVRYFSKKLVCPTSGISYDEPDPNTFSFNSPKGFCPRCRGLGYIEDIDLNKLVPDPNKSIRQGAILPLGKYKSSAIFWQLDALLKLHGFSLDTPFKNLSQQAVNEILYGSDKILRLSSTPLGSFAQYFSRFDGLVNEILYGSLSDKSTKFQDLLHKRTCPVCNGTRLKKQALYFKIHDKNIAQLSQMQLDKLYDWLLNVENFLSEKQKAISRDIIKQITSRLYFLIQVGLSYLTLDRPASTLSGGESQRIRLATQLGSNLVNVLYILDEPSIGLHPRDNLRLIKALKDLTNQQNTVIVVEHDDQIMKLADYIIDLGPGAGPNGGHVVAQGTPEQFLKSNSLTAQYLSGSKKIPVPLKRRKGSGKFITIYGAKGNNLKNITVSFPLNTFICITGVSGSGKSSLINDTLYPALAQKLHHAKIQPLPFDDIQVPKEVKKVVVIDQQPIGKTPRSVPATYTKIFDQIRKIFAQTPAAKIRGYTPGRFSFNIKGGRCETCKGTGVQIIEMKLLPDVYVTCPDCNGSRYNRQTLEIRFKGKTIADVLDMTVEQALDFFQNFPSITHTLQAMYDVGLGYLKLGQSSTTLSGGEAQRVKLAAELSKKASSHTLYILDEPTTGMHFEDINKLLKVLHKLVDKGNTVIVIEHNMEIIKNADWIIDLGPEGGDKGGQIICSGTPEQIINCKNSYTAEFLAQYLQ